MTLKRFAASLVLWLLLCPALSSQNQDLSVDSLYGGSVHTMFASPLAADTVVEMAIPNVFTPNADGVNDYFEVATDGSTIYAFSIFTRAGVRIYHSRSPRIFWDGRSLDGLDYPEGIYYYVIEEMGNEQPATETGFIHLFR